jgi:hypothetical protein
VANKLLDLARVTTATTGTGTITLGPAVSGFLTFAQAGAADGDVVTYGIADGANCEIGYGVYTASGTTLTRNVYRSTGAGNTAPISLSGSAQVFVTLSAEDVVPTGTGSLVRAASPTLSGVLTVNGGGSTNVLVGQATDTPDLTYNVISLNGSLVPNSTNFIGLEGGGSGDPALYILGGTGGGAHLFDGATLTAKFLAAGNTLIATAATSLAVTTAPSLSIAPTGNPTTTLSSQNVQASATSANGREFLVSIGFTSAIGNGGTAGNDKVGAYVGMVGNAGSANIWATNHLTTANTGFFGTTHDAQVSEFDLNNNDKDVLVAATPTGFTLPCATGVAVNGGGAFRSTSAFVLGAGKWQFGYTAFGDVSQAAFYESTTATFGLDLQGAHATGLRVGGTVTPISLDLSHATDQRVLFRGKQNLSTGSAISSINTANSAFEGLELQGSSISTVAGLRLGFPVPADPGGGSIAITGSLLVGTTIQLASFTVATLPVAGTVGRMACVTDALAPTYNGALTGGGTVKIPVFDNGVAWTAH